MDVIRMFNIVEALRNLILLYNQQYREQEFDNNNIERVVLLRKGLRETGMADLSYWKDTGIDVYVLNRQLKEIENALMEHNYIFIYDLLNYEIWQSMKQISEVIFKNNGNELREYFWKENIEALKVHHLDVVAWMEGLSEDTGKVNIRTYGIRGRVVFRKNGEQELDLFSAYCPVQTSMMLLESSDINRYSKIYVWGSNGGFEADAIVYIKGFKNVDIEVFVTDLSELKQVLKNTRRNGWLLSPFVNWKFNVDITDFIEKFNLQEKEKSYIYIKRCSDRERLILESFIIKYNLNSNLKEYKC